MFWLRLLAALAASHSSPHLSKADLDDAAVRFYVPDGQPLRAKLTRRLGPPTRVEGNEAIWEAWEGRACWHVRLLAGPDDKDGIFVPPEACWPRARYTHRP